MSLMSTVFVHTILESNTTKYLNFLYSKKNLKKLQCISACYMICSKRKRKRKTGAIPFIGYKIYLLSISSFRYI